MFDCHEAFSIAWEARILEVLTITRDLTLEIEGITDLVFAINVDASGI